MQLVDDVAVAAAALSPDTADTLQMQKEGLMAAYHTAGCNALGVSCDMCNVCLVEAFSDDWDSVYGTEAAAVIRTLPHWAWPGCGSRGTSSDSVYLPFGYGPLTLQVQLRGRAFHVKPLQRAVLGGKLDASYGCRVAWSRFGSPKEALAALVKAIQDRCGSCRWCP